MLSAATRWRHQDGKITRRGSKKQRHGVMTRGGNKASNGIIARVAWQQRINMRQMAKKRTASAKTALIKRESIEP